MKNVSTLIILFTLLGFVSCNKADENPIEVIYYGHKDITSDSVFQYFEIDSFDKFQNLYENVEDISCDDKFAVVKISFRNKEKHIVFHNQCARDYSCILINRRNVLRIVDEEVVIDKSYDLEDLDSLLQLHYINSNRSPYHCAHPSKAIVSIKYQKSNMKGFSNLLDQLTDSFEKIELDVNLVIILDLDRALSKIN